MLGLGDPPHKQVDTAFVLGEIDGHLLADNRPGQVRDLEASSDRIVVGKRDKLHPGLPQPVIRLERIRIACRKIQAPEDPIGSTVAVASVNVQVGTGDRRVHEFVADSHPS